ncbi:putative glucose-methanol-choline oxidoreductase [Hypoxylon rubiginosum]|uniref:Glucose-methanol-choline oxidoreductase n=1 Tax=Hypoxylon rubiginosum TaxID=110542 RepID=A0ACB9YX86_9PEZI|nr:putative glucose-methanol-choline oxidoreductase [Hypoxylon rubiginosum]
MPGITFTGACLRAALTLSLAALIKAEPLLGSSFGIPGDDATYDYVVVGGGTAGLTLATRLIEQNAGTVAVIEAGTFYEITNGNLSQIPAMDTIFSWKGLKDWQPLVDWGYITTPQVGGLNQTLHYARGKTLGGTSARNYMVYQRGTAESYNEWADLVGDDAYTFDNFIPFLEKSTNFSGPDQTFRFANSTPDYDSAFSGDSTGPLSVTFPNYAQAFATWAAEGLAQIGMAPISGFLGGKLIGSAWSMSTVNRQTMMRESSETAFLRTAIGNPNYMVYPLTMAKKILFDDSKTATGVAVESGGFAYTLSARKEVIVSAGAFGSPQMLLVSGVGPAEDLTALNIPVVADRPGVGKGMQDHVFFGVSYRVNAPTSSSLSIADFAAEQSDLFQSSASGMLTTTGIEVLGWEKIPDDLRSGWSNTTTTTLAAYPEDWPEVEYLSASTLLGTMQDSRAPGDGFNYGTLAVALAAPRSRGSVTINSDDTNVSPNIDPNFLSDQADIDVMIAGVKRARQFFNSDAMQSFVIGDEAFPGNNVTTDAEIETAVRTDFETVWHAACTCAMGKADDTNAVVDSQARVIGVQNLRVVDASSFPILVPGHPQSTIYGLAEKIACDISGNC